MNGLEAAAPAAGRAAEQARFRRERRRAALAQLVRTVGTVVIALVFGFVITLFVSDRPVQAYLALLTGPVSSAARVGTWIEDATTLTMLGLSIAVVFRAQQFSLLAEGQLYLGALAAGIIALKVPAPAPLHLAIAVLGAAAAAFAFGLIPGALKAYYGANEIVSTLMLNVVAVRTYDLLLTYWLKPPGAGYTWSDPFPPSAVFTRFLEGSRINTALFVAAALVVLTWFLVYKTPLGYELRMVGANLEFARYGGIDVRRTIMLSMALAGIPAGLAGAHLAMGVHQRLLLNISLGLAFEGIVVALMAGNHPLLVPLAALLYSYLRIGGDIMERTAAVGSDIVRVIQATIILFITAELLVGVSRRRQARRTADAAG
ncbi:MAG: ABC transporter permease [Armatimonadota bacterium]|nr:ABC transporter permease [Armatimonadota bacterium]MDR7499805.1 ABC transporter permease [Armatimonadota bacterium]MDR7505249.1 ABC transporter permease [Armatimonadota bacterium]MDR7547882.1 ABC transporter permease [Armatimonadota bacterium]MDR7559328.1 ABC transporter permease [Armatimonadota bacterium]